MKRFIVFIVSFVLLYIVFQVLTGMILTALYTPDFSHMQDRPSQKVTFGNASLLRFIATFLPATLAHFISQKAVKKEAFK